MRGAEGGERRTAAVGGSVEPDWFPELYVVNYASLVRIAAAVLADRSEAEDVVQEAFVRAALAHRRLRDRERALAYIRQAVVNLCRSRLRRRLIVRRHLTTMAVDEGRNDAAIDGEASLERHSVIAALQKLPPRRREALVWRYFADLSIDQTAQAMGVTVGAVKSACARGLAELAGLLGEQS